MSLARQITIGSRKIDVPVTVVDQVVNFFSPAWGSERYRTRVRMALTGGYTGADRTRRANTLGGKREMDANTAIIPDLGTLREDSQHMIRNNAIAGGAVRTNVTKVVGTGLKVRAQIDRAILKIDENAADEWERQAEREFRLATETREIDIERQLPFSLLQGLTFLKVLEDGDLLVNMPRLSRPGSPYKLKLQLIEAARISNPNNTANTPTLCAGVEKDDTGAPIRYHVSSRHPGSMLGIGPRTLQWEPVQAFNPKTGAPLALYLLDKTRPGQSRGVPYLSPVIELIKQLGRYTDAEVMAAVVSGMLTVFVTNENADPTIGTATTETTSGDTDDTSGMELGYGTVLGLLPGEKIESVDPNRPNTAFDPFVMAVLRQIGVALEIPFELLVKHFTASYSASRAALMEAWDYFRRRRHWLVTMLCQPVYEAVISEAVAMGRLKAPGFFADPLIRQAWLGTTWIGDAPYHLDPLKEVNAAGERMNLLLTTHEEECAAMPQGGASWQAKIPQIIKEKRIITENDLQPATKTAPDPGVVEPVAPPDPNKPETDLEET